MLKRIVTTACYAGAIAALLLTLMQSLWTSPLILQAETYESTGVGGRHLQAANTHQHTHQAEAWAPKDGWQRIVSTFGGNLVVAIGFASILCALYNLRTPIKPWSGALWGLAGFATFCLAPAMGLPPELPGTLAAELSSRQVWWGATALSTAVGLAFMVLQKVRLWQALGLALLVMPHVIGAPQPPESYSLSPDALQAQFRIASILINGVFWVVLGTASAWLFWRH